MKRPEPKPFAEINFQKMYNEIVKLTEEQLDWLDEGWDEITGYNENEDILEDNDDGILISAIESIYGESYQKYMDLKTGVNN